MRISKAIVIVLHMNCKLIYIILYPFSNVLPLDYVHGECSVLERWGL